LGGFIAVIALIDAINLKRLIKIHIEKLASGLEFKNIIFIKSFVDKLNI